MNGATVGSVDGKDPTVYTPALSLVDGTEVPTESVRPRERETVGGQNSPTVYLPEASTGSNGMRVETALESVVMVDWPRTGGYRRD